MRKLLFPASVVLFVAAVGLAFAQSNPGLRFKQVPTAAEWNSYFSAKVDLSGYIPASRTTLSGPTSFYVDGLAGNDANGCLAPGAGACKTLPAAITLIASKYDLACNDVTIQLAGTGGTPQTYTGNFVVLPLVGGCDNSALTITGDTTTPANVTLTSAGTTLAIGAQGQAPGAMLKLQGVTITSSGGSCINVVDGSRLTVSGNMTFGACPAGQHIAVARHAHVLMNSNYMISGGAQSHWSLAQNATLNGASITVTLTGTPAFSNAFFVTQLNASSNNLAGIIFSGPATGTRYSAISGGIINTGGSGANFLPGNAAGSTSTNGQYL